MVLSSAAVALAPMSNVGGIRRCRRLCDIRLGGLPGSPSATSPLLMTRRVSVRAPFGSFRVEIVRLYSSSVDRPRERICEWIGLAGGNDAGGRTSGWKKDSTGASRQSTGIQR
jgi:hypothetical protein